MYQSLLVYPCILAYLIMTTCTMYYKDPVQSNSLYCSECLTSELANTFPNNLDNTAYHQAVLAFHKRPKLSRPILKTGRHHHLLYLSTIMLLQAADCELNPGPKGPKYPYLVCTKVVRWNQHAIACDNCEGWYHTNCIDMGSHIYHALAKPDVSWICCQCGLPNFSTSFFESVDVTTSNLYDPLSDISLESDIGDPIIASSPKHQHKPSDQNP